ncbi:MAG: metal-binding protein [Clostridiales bacterium]|nr:metal-binding protein [Clostridiales bacterium]
MENSFKFFSNTKCKYFPCHKTSDIKDFNCLFCFCPLYSLGDKCGGDFIYLENGVKDCTNCILPHKAENYQFVLYKLSK